MVFQKNQVADMGLFTDLSTLSTKGNTLCSHIARKSCNLAIENI